MANDPHKAALLAAKEDLLAAYSSVHSSLGRLISLVHGSEPRAIADVLGSEFDHHPRSPPPAHLRGGAGQPGYSGSSRYPEPSKHSSSTPLYPAPPQPQPNQTRSNGPAGPSFTAVNPAANHHARHDAAYVKDQQRKHRQPSSHPYSAQSAQPLETDDDEDDEDDPEEPASDDDRPTDPAFYAPQRATLPITNMSGLAPNGKKVKKVKRERDPNAPKRPASAYILFQNAVRQEMRAANPTADYKELARQIGDRWKNLSDEAKRPWSEAGKQAMTSWNIQNKEYKTLHPEVVSPHTHSTTSSGGAPHAPVVRKKRSAPRVPELDEHGNALRKKRGRPSKADREAIERHMHVGQHQHNALQHSQVAAPPGARNGHAPAPVTQAAPAGAYDQTHTVAPAQQANGDEASEEEEDDDDDDDDDDEESYEQGPVAPAQLSRLSNGTVQAASVPMDAGESEEEDDEDVEDDDDSEHSGAEDEVDDHTSKKIKVQPNGVMA